MSEPLSGWGRKFEEPIALPDGRKLILLRDAARYNHRATEEGSGRDHWQAAIEALMLVLAFGGRNSRGSE